MAGYSPLYIKAMETGLVQSRQEFILPEDAYPILENAYVWRERLKRKKAYQLLGRLQRNFANLSLGISGASPWSFNIYSGILPPIVPETNAQIVPGSVILNFSTTVTTGTIIGYNNTTNCEVFTSAPHGLSTGNVITISGVVVVPGSGDNAINGGPYVISVVSPTSFTINRDSQLWGVYSSGGTWSEDVGSTQLIDQGNGTLATVPASGITGTINYLTGAVVIIGAPSGVAVLITFSYYPGLPVMGIRNRELQNAVNDETIFFDTKYAYNYNSGFQEFLPGTTWTGTDFEFFWTTNYWVGNGNLKIFWATNFSVSGDPIRYTNGQSGTNWINFSPIVDAAGNTLNQCLALLPFRGRLVAFNTRESTGPYSNRIRWAAIGNPFTVVSAIVSTVNSKAWRDDIRGQGGFLDIPTSEDIVSVGFVRDNLVIYCERSTWQLRYTGRTIAPFQIEKVNSELGASSTFSAIQFDTSLVGIGDKGIVECDSFKSQRIDIKIPDLVFHFQDQNHGLFRIQGIRDFINRLAYWTYVGESDEMTDDTVPALTIRYPNRRLVYNYENDSWAIFTDSLTALGTFQEQQSRTWVNTHIPWIQCNFPWIDQPSGDPVIVGGNQQGFIEQLDEQTTNDPSLYITAITANNPNATIVTSPNHNLETGQVILISGIPIGTPFDNLNGGVFSIIVNDVNNFQLTIYNPLDGQFSLPQVDTTTGFIGVGNISVRDNFSIVSKKFNFADDGQSIQMGFIDILMDSTELTNPGAISLNVYLDYNDNQVSNTVPQNVIADDSTLDLPDGFFNSIIPTTQSTLNGIGGSKFWQRVYCSTRANFITLQYTFNNAQMAGIEQELDVQIDAQILWLRRAGRMTSI